MRKAEWLKSKCPMPELLHRLGLGRYAQNSCRSPIRRDSHASWGIFQWGDNWYFKDHGTEEKGDEISLIGLLYDLDPKVNFREILEIYESIHWETNKVPPQIEKRFRVGGRLPEMQRSKPNDADFYSPSPEDLAAIAEGRPYGLAGLEWIDNRRMLWFNSDWHDQAVYAVTDQSGKVLEVRRVDNQVFPAVPSCGLGERKSHALKHSQKSWPVGILESQDYPAIALMEGIPDLIEAHDALIEEQGEEPTCAPVAMLSASTSIAEEALPHFKGKTVRIFFHADKAGIRAAKKWQQQLVEAEAASVDFYQFAGLLTDDGQPVSDLYDLRHLYPQQNLQNSSSDKIFPQ